MPLVQVLQEFLYNAINNVLPPVTATFSPTTPQNLPKRAAKDNSASSIHQTPYTQELYWHGENFVPMPLLIPLFSDSPFQPHQRAAPVLDTLVTCVNCYQGWVTDITLEN